MRFEFIDPRTTPFVQLKSRGELPHLYKDGGSYFVTFRLLDAVQTLAGSARHSGCDAGVPPAEGAAETAAPQHPRAAETAAPQSQSAQRNWQDPERYAAEIAARSEPPLRLGSCILQRPDIADLTQNALIYFHDDRYYLSAWCVMPNHVHAVVTPSGPWELSSILHSWKSFTSHRANEILGRGGELWERESFDHLIRSYEHLEGFIHYVEMNPVEAGLCQSAEDWPWSSARFRGVNQ